MISTRKKLQSASVQQSVRLPWYESTGVMGLLGATLMWLSVPPLDLGFLGWIAPICWLLLVRRSLLAGRRPYLMLYLVGWLYFGATFYWIMIPHVSAIFGWIALTTYLAFYVLFFISLSRVAVHGLGISLLFAAPVVWTGLEFIRAHLLTGFLMAALAHTQHRWLSVIQMSDLLGAYGVSFLVMFVAAALARALPYEGQRKNIWFLLPAGLAVVAAVVYGQFRMQHGPGLAGPSVALIQGNVDTEFDVKPGEMKRRIKEEYLQLTREVLKNHQDIDLVVWPESMSMVPLITIDQGAWLPAEVTAGWPIVGPEEAARLETERRLPDAVHRLAEHSVQGFGALMAYLSEIRKGDDRTELRLIVGADAEHYETGRLRRYNSSVYLSGSGEVLGRYNKMHLVVFGEYVPLGDLFPDLYKLTPLMGGLTPGDEPVVYDVLGVRFAPNICYETVLPQVIRRQLLLLKEQDREADVIISQTNDGWFWGSAALDMHMICGIFRAVEFRKPLLIAANTGFSASINADGLVEWRGPRRAAATMVVRPQIEQRGSLYLQLGDLLGQFCAACCLGLLLYGLFQCCWPRKCAAVADE